MKSSLFHLSIPDAGSSVPAFLFNNAGIEGEQAPTHLCTLENWNKVLSISLNGVFFGMKYALEKMKEQGSGVIINTSSLAGLVGMENLPAYILASDEA